MYCGCRLIEQVDGLVRQEAVVYIPHGELVGRAHRPGGEPDAVVPFKRCAHTAQHLHRLLAVGLADLHRLEAPFERGVLFDVPPVFLRRRRADYLHLAAAERGLEDVCRVYRALGAARADDRVQLVYKEDDVTRAAHIAQHGLHALLKIPAVLCPCEHRRDIQRHYALVFKLCRCLPLRNAHRQALRDGGLADARLPDEHRVILAAAREDLYRAAYLLRPPDDGVEGSACGEVGQVAAVLVEHARVRAAYRAARRARLRLAAEVGISEHGHDVGVDIIEVAAGLAQNGGGSAVALTQQTEQQVLGADVALLKAARLLRGALHRALCPFGQPLARLCWTADAAAAYDDAAQPLAVKPLRAQNARAEAVLLRDDAEQQMLGADIAVTQLTRRCACVFDGKLCPLREFFVAFDMNYPLGAPFIIIDYHP